jgi:hypothetical protein
MRRLISLGAVLICVVSVTLASLAEVASAAQPAPAWSVVALPFPTAFAPGSVYDATMGGPGYQIEAFNVGGGATEGKFEVVVTLPTGLRPVPGFPATGVYGPAAEPSSLNCSSSGHTVRCTGGEGGEVVGQGEGATLTVPVEAQSSVAEGAILTTKATIEGGGAAGATTTAPTPIRSARSPFGFIAGPAGSFGLNTDIDGTPTTQAGAHPYQATVAGMGFATNPGNSSIALLPAGGGLRDARAELPKGFNINPLATNQCKESELTSGINGCPENTQVGVVAIPLSLFAGLGTEPPMRPLFNMVPPPGHPAELGFEVLEGIYVHFLGAVKSDGSFTLTAASENVLAKVTLAGVRTTLWGDPTDASHDAQRGECVLRSRRQPTCPLAEGERSPKAFVSMPSSCGGPLETRLAIDSWLAPGEFVNGSYLSTDPAGNPVGVSGCSDLRFEPSISVKATTDQGESPSGLNFDLHQVQHESIGELAGANLKNATVTLPEGMVLNPSAANGREACSAAQVGVSTAPGVTPIRYLEGPAQCPNASKLGTVQVKTPLLDHELSGSVYLAKPFDNPFGTLLGIYLVVEDEASGIIAKLAGKVTPDSSTGRLTTTFEESPELPLEDVELHLYGGSRAALTTPISCGTNTTASTLTPWSTPEGADAHPADSFATTGSCSSSEAAAPKTVDFNAGTATPLSGAYSPFVLRISRPDGTQHISGIETTLPAGLLGKLAGISYCPESGIAQAISREHPEQGKLEQQSPSCPSSSEVGSANVTAGSGPNPIAVSGHAYLAGPYRGAPLSLVVIVPAVAGPFDLGTVVDRVALNVGEYDARIHAVADPLPTIREGIPLDVRSIELKLDRPSFTLNPTSCEAMAIEGSVSTQAGQSQSLSNRFQVGECGRLAFKPKLQISLKGATGKTGHPALKAVVTYPQQGAFANIARAQVNLPHSEFLDQGNIAKACTKVILAQRACPAKSIYGKVKAWTPLLEKPLEGPVYLVGGYGYKLPALVAELDGQIRVLLVGKIDSGKNHGIRNTFEAVPDAPVSRFVLQMKGGKKYGLLENSENICKKPQKAGAAFRAQNGKVLQLSPKIANSCGKGKASGSGKKKSKVHKKSK